MRRPFFASKIPVMYPAPANDGLVGGLYALRVSCSGELCATVGPDRFNSPSPSNTNLAGGQATERSNRNCPHRTSAQLRVKTISTANLS